MNPNTLKQATTLTTIAITLSTALTTALTLGLIIHLTTKQGKPIITPIWIISLALLLPSWMTYYLVLYQTEKHNENQP